MALKPEKRIIIKLPKLIATQEFEPTKLMIKTISAYLQALDQDKALLDSTEGSIIIPPFCSLPVKNRILLYYSLTITVIGV